MSTNIHDILKDLGDAIDGISKRQVQKTTILDRELSGDKINGGMITNFASVGIKDTATKAVLQIADDGVRVNVIYANVIASPLIVKGNLTVEGEIHARKLHVDEISADIRNERTSPLEFKGENGSPSYGKGLIWTGGDYTKQFVLQSKPDRFFSSESIDLFNDKHFSISGLPVLTQTELGTSIVKSNLRRVGTLEELRVAGNVVIDEFLFWDADNQRLGLGTEAPNGAISIMSWDHEFIIDPTEDKKFKIGTWTTTALEIVTDDTTRIDIAHNGVVTFHDKVILKQKLGVGVKNFAEDADITTAGPVRFQDKKFEVGTEEPTTGTYKKGDIVWDADPKAGGYAGWICIREGAPGMWKPFGQIAV
jgi:hypothetical protein